MGDSPACDHRHFTIWFVTECSGRGPAFGITDLYPCLGSAPAYSDSGQRDHVLTPFSSSGCPTPLIVLSGCLLLLCLCCRFRLIYLEITSWDHSKLRPKPTLPHQLTLSSQCTRMSWFTLSSEYVSAFECPATSSSLASVFISHVYVLLHLYLEVSRYLTFNPELKLSLLNQVHFPKQSIPLDAILFWILLLPHLRHQLQLILSLR